MLHAERALALSELRERIGRLEGRGRARKALRFGVRTVDRHLPGGGLTLNSLHEVMETGAADRRDVRYAVRKHVVTSSDRPLTWNNSQPLVGDPAEAVARLLPR